MGQHIFQTFVVFGFLVLGVFVYSEALAKNPFQSGLPEAPKKAPVAAVVEAKPIPKVVLPPKPEIKMDPPKLVLNGLIWNSSQPQAIIDGEIVKLGDVIKDVKIKKITRSGVEGDFKGVKVYLKP